MDQNYDHRAAAYVGAVERVRAAESVKAALRRSGPLPETLPDEYWSLIAEADIFAQLARADMSVGLLAGNYLVDQGERIDRNRRRKIRRDVQDKLDQVRRGGKHPNLMADPFDPAEHRGPVRVIVTADGAHKHRTGLILENRLSADSEPAYKVHLDPDPAADWTPRSAEIEWFDRSQLDLVVG